MHITANLIKSLTPPAGATHLRLTTDKGKTAVAPRDRAPVNFDGTDGELEWGAIIGGKFAPISGGKVAEKAPETPQDAPAAPKASKPTPKPATPQAPPPATAPAPVVDVKAAVLAVMESDVFTAAVAQIVLNVMRSEEARAIIDEAAASVTEVELDQRTVDELGTRVVAPLIEKALSGLKSAPAPEPPAQVAPAPVEAPAPKKRTKK